MGSKLSVSDERVREVHRWYMADSDRTVEDAAWEAGLSPSGFSYRIRTLGLETKSASARTGKPHVNTAKPGKVKSNAKPLPRGGRAKRGHRRRDPQSRKFG